MAIQCSSIARVAIAALFIGASAQATILNEYSDLSSWNAATTSQVTQNFNGIGSPNSLSAAGVTLNSVNYQGFYNESSTVGYDTYLWGNPSAGFNFGTGGYMLGGPNSGVLGTGVSSPDSGIRIDLSGAPASNALAFDFSAFRFANPSGNVIYSTAGTPINLTLQVYEGGSLTGTRTLTVPAGSPALGFYGFTTTGTISSVRILISTPNGTDGNRIAIDNLAYAQVVQQGPGNEDPPPTGGDIPEPQTYLLCGAGLMAAAVLKRRKS